ncbi:polygalacturonase-like [Arachis duranensis]|uniref:Polygalacturonase-like n=1 Tax=Arachis duranensis TaxID=130453 RepID=A0A6P4BVC7_ARADU|nr:polygalacturonase-like [Arachis duranensis]
MMKSSITTLVLFILLATSSGIVQSADIPISKFGGVPNSDITQALANAWNEACQSATASKIMIPSGQYRMKAVAVKGPCKAPIELYVDGTIIAPPNPKDLNNEWQWVKFEYVDFLTISGSGVFDGQGATAWKLNDCGKNPNCARLSMNFGFNFVKHSVVGSITSKDSKNFNVNVLGCQNFTFDGFKISNPGNSINTDGIHMGRSTDVKILNTNIATGDDCISIGDGSVQTTISNVKCGPGHGISVGSLGKFTTELPVQDLMVKQVTFTNTDNGLRIKTWPSAPGTSPITGLTYQDITMINVKNPIIIDQEYCPWNQCSKQSPSKIKISNVTFKNIRGTSGTQEGVSLICSSGVPCEGVVLSDVDLTFNGSPATAVCRNAKPMIQGKSPQCTAPKA